MVKVHVSLQISHLKSHLWWPSRISFCIPKTISSPIFSGTGCNTLISSKILQTLDSTQFQHTPKTTVHHSSSSSDIANHWLEGPARSRESVSRPLVCWHTLHARWIASNIERCHCWWTPYAVAVFWWFTGGCKCFPPTVFLCRASVKNTQTGGAAPCSPHWDTQRRNWFCSTGRTNLKTQRHHQCGSDSMCKLSVPHTLITWLTHSFPHADSICNHQLFIITLYHHQWFIILITFKLSNKVSLQDDISGLPQSVMTSS